MTDRLRIISGGQTGADRGALCAAKARGIETGGWVPRGWLTEAGPCPELATLYGLLEAPEPDYPARTRRNVQMATALLWFGNPHSPGGRLTLRLAMEATIPQFVVIQRDCLSADAVQWLRGMVFPGEDAVTLMVAGNRESKSPGIGAWVERFLGGVLDLIAEDDWREKP